jgi:restriction system protein
MADRECDELVEQASESWRAELLIVLTSMSPDSFERLCARLVRSLGCRDVEVSRYSDDEGLDGTGVLQVSLLSFPVFFQAKRYKIDRPIQPNKIREFRGAMAHRGDKGFFITTSVFTARARDEARRGGAPIDLIDGEILCDLLYEHGLGVESRPVVVPEFFADL